MTSLKRKRQSGAARLFSRYLPADCPNGLAAFDVEDSRFSLRVDRSVTRAEVEALLRVERSA